LEATPDRRELLPRGVTQLSPMTAEEAALQLSSVADQFVVFATPTQIELAYYINAQMETRTD